MKRRKARSSKEPKAKSNKEPKAKSNKEPKARIIKEPKARGEWGESVFMVRAVEQGLAVSRPWGDSNSFDFVVGKPGRFVSVQVKSTTVKNGGGYVCAVRQNGAKYAPGAFDFLAAYVIPEDVWYIIPAKKLGGIGYVTLCSNSGEANLGSTGRRGNCCVRLRGWRKRRRRRIRRRVEMRPKERGWVRGCSGCRTRLISSGGRWKRVGGVKHPGDAGERLVECTVRGLAGTGGFGFQEH